MNDCKFCALIRDGKAADRLPNLLLETESAIVAVNRRPLAPGHLTLILKAHRNRTGEMRDDDLLGIGTLAGRVSTILERHYQPRRVALLGDGKPSAHLHFHFIPEPAGAPLDLGAVVSDLNLTPRPNTLNDAETAALVETLRSSLVNQTTPQTQGADTSNPNQAPR